MKKNIEVNIEITPEEMAAMWCIMHDDEQVRFLNEIGRLVTNWGPGSYEMQMQFITDNEQLTDRARYVMELMGDYAQKEVE